MKTREIIYNELFDLLSKSELAARNGEWMTCGTWAKNVTELAYKYGNDQKDPENKPMNPIENMTDREVRIACHEILGLDMSEGCDFTGAMLKKLAEWNYIVKIYPTGTVAIYPDGMTRNGTESDTLPIAFLLAAHALEKWKPEVKEDKIEWEYWQDQNGAVVSFHPLTVCDKGNWKRVRVTPWEEPTP